jgi:hypothetical protein
VKRVALEASCSAACGDAAAAVLQQLFLEDHWQGLSATQFDTTAMQFSADAFAKHSGGIQPFFCRDQESDCRNNDKGIQKKHGVWFIPNQGVNEPGNMMPCIFNESFFRKSQKCTENPSSFVFLEHQVRQWQ